MKSQALTPPHTTRHQNKYQIRSCDLYGKNHFAFHRSQRRNVKNDDKAKVDPGCRRQRNVATDESFVARNVGNR